MLASSILERRRLRARFFASNLFDEIAWDLLLTLYCDEGHGRTHSRDSLSSSIDGPASTTSRWIDALVAQGLVTLKANLFGATVNLTDDGRSRLEHYLDAASNLDP
jgi:DNA-binding MarR family transcriptional regulator